MVGIDSDESDVFSGFSYSFISQYLVHIIYWVGL